MYPSDECGMSITDIEAITTLCSKSLEVADQVTRHSLSCLVGHLLASTQSEMPSAPESSQKGNQDSGRGNDEALSSHTGSNGHKTMLSISEMLNLLSSQFNKLHVSRRVRVGVFDFYAALLSKLGSAFVESNYALVVGHFMTEIVSNPRNTTTRYDTLLIRHLVEIILRDLIGVRMLSEQGQIGAIQELSRSYLRRWPAMMPGQVSPIPSVLAIILRETAGLLKQLGNAPPPVQVCIALQADHSPVECSHY
jgi:HEAT repeat-containing protein 5